MKNDPKDSKLRSSRIQIGERIPKSKPWGSPKSRGEDKSKSKKRRQKMRKQ